MEIVDLSAFLQSESNKCAEIFRDNGQYWFVCYHCGATSLSSEEIKNHIDTHFEESVAINDNDNITSEEDPELLLNSSNLVKEKDVDKDNLLNIASLENEEIAEIDSEHNVKPYKCEKCCFECSDEKSLQKHIDADHKNIYFECDICDQIFTQLSNLECHLKQHVKLKKQQNLEPTKQFHLESHRKMEHNVENQENPKQFQCEMCEKEFNTRRKYYYHKEMHKGKIFPCSKCNLTLKTKSILDQHVRNVHTKNLTFKCDMCPMEFDTRRKFYYHKEMHKGQTFSCIKCTFTSKTKSNLEQHLTNVHAENVTYKFECKLCTKLFKYKNTYDYHMKLHAGKKPYQCSICGVAFLTRNYLDLHTKSVHSTETFKCTICNKEFNSMRCLKRHSKSHTDDRTHRCTICDNNFKTSETLRKHKMLHDNVKQFKCSFCDMKFAQPSGRRMHEKSKHLLV